MSSTGAASLILGIPITNADFYAVVGEEYRCQRGHVRDADSDKPFCPDCGGPLKAHNLTEPKPWFKDWADKRGMPHEDLWYEISEDSTGRNVRSLGVHNAAALTAHHSDLALGFCLVHIGGWQWDEGIANAEPLDDLKTYSKRLKKKLLEAGFPEMRPVTLYTTLYHSG